MIRVFAALCVMFLAADVSAQEKVEVLGISKGQIFSARLTIQSAGPQQLLYHHTQINEKPIKIGELVSGKEYKIRSGHYRFGWPQHAAYIVMEGDKEVLRTEATYEPITLKFKAGQKLQVEFARHYEPYDGRLFKVKDVWCSIILPRAYWYQDVSPGQFKGPEAYPNSLFFLVDEEWGFGEKRCFDELAAFAAKTYKAAKIPDQEDFRANHITVNIALNAEGKHQKVLMDLSEDDLRTELRKGLGKAWDDMKSYKAYRPFDGQSGPPIAALKQAGFLPKDWANDRTCISYAEALEMAKEGARKWREDHPERDPRKKKKDD